MLSVRKYLLVFVFVSSLIVGYAQEQHQAELMPAGDGTYSLVDAKYLRDGYRSVSTIPERDAIPTDRRKYGMLVYVGNVDTIYQLKSISLNNSNWVAWKSLGGIIYSTGYGLTLSSNAFYVDSTLLSTRVRHQKAIDSLGNASVKYSDTLGMLQNYVLGRNNLTTVGSIPFVNSSGVLQQNDFNLFWDDANKRLGIGNKTPLYKLTVTDGITTPTASISAPLVALQSNGSAQISLKDNSTSIEYLDGTSLLGYGISGTITNHDFRLRSNNMDRLTLQAGGNVGIGTTNPTSILTVANSKSSTIPVLRLDTLLSGGSTDSLMLWRSADSSVRKNTASSFINGTAWGLTGNSGTNASNNFIGTTDGNALAFKVNNQKSGQISPSAYSTSLGYQSLSNNFLIVNNHTAIGYSALANNSTGNANTAVGVLSLSNNSNGSQNTATGYWSLSNNQSGSNNTAYGFETLTSSTTGNDNTALGFEALYNSNSNFNTALGSNALYNNISGNNNIGIGNKAGYNVSTGSNNIIIGSNQSVTAVTGSNQMNIGGLIFGTNMTGDQNAPSGNIGIGTTNPTSRLTVANNKNTTVPIMKLDTLLSGNYGDSLVVYRRSDSSIRKQTASNFINNTAWGLTGNSSTNSAFNFLGTTDNHPLLFKTAGTTKLFIDSATNRVGIGTTSPANIFHVSSTNYQVGLFQTNTDALLQVGSTNYSSRSGISFSGLGGYAAFTLMQNSSNQTLSLIPSANINTTPIWTISNSGYLGIKSTSPMSPLTVANNKNTTIPIIRLDTLLSGNYSDSLVVYRSSDSSIRKQTASNFINNMTWGLTGNSSTNSAFNFLGTTDNHPLVFKTNGATKFFIDSSTNNIGIGTAIPSSPLHVSYTNSAISGTTYGFKITPTYNQASSTATNTDLLINRTQNAIGSGTQNLIDAQVGGVSKFSISNAATLTLSNVATNISMSIGPYNAVLIGAGNTYNSNGSGTFTMGKNNYIGSDNSVAFGVSLYTDVGSMAMGRNIRNIYAGSFQVGNSDNGKMSINTSGNIGIGTVNAPNTFSVSPIVYNTGTAYQSGTNVTGIGTTFTPAMVGYTFMFSSGVSSGSIIAYNSPTSLTVSVSQSVANSSTAIPYTINYTGFHVSSTGNASIGTTNPTSTLEVNGSVARAINTITTDITLNDTHSTIVVTGGTPIITLPAANTCARRIYVIVNQTITGITISGYLDFTGSTVTMTPANGSVTLQSDGISWYRIQ